LLAHACQVASPSCCFLCPQLLLLLLLLLTAATAAGAAGADCSYCCCCCCAAPADAPEEPQQVCVLDHLTALITHGAHELEQPDGCIYTAEDSSRRQVQATQVLSRLGKHSAVTQEHQCMGMLSYASSPAAANAVLGNNPT
jgi:hypothetical protein